MKRGIKIRNRKRRVIQLAFNTKYFVRWVRDEKDDLKLNELKADKIFLEFLEQEGCLANFQLNSGHNGRNG